MDLVAKLITVNKFKCPNCGYQNSDEMEHVEWTEKGALCGMCDKDIKLYDN